MIFAIIVLAIIGITAFFHYVQGFFSATLSAVITIISAVLAVSYHEPVVEMVFGSKWTSVSHAITLAVMFGLTYLILRILFDKMVPGNVRFPALLDKIGGAAMGIVAGVFAAGIVTLTAGYLPFMPAVAQYARYGVESTREVTMPPTATQGRSFTSATWHELKSQKVGQFDEADKSRLIVPVDDIVVNTVSHLSDNGSLSGKQKLRDVHPDLPTELFAQRLGVQTGASRVAPKEGVNPVELYTTPALTFRDHDYKALRTLDLKGMPVSGTQLRPTNKQILLIVRVTFTRFASDSDHFVRFSPGSARLVTRAPGGAEGEMVNNFPIGTVEGANTLYLNKPDDFLLAKEDAGVDFAYLLDRSALLGGSGQGQKLTVADGTFFEFKRMAREDLGGKTISTSYKPDEHAKVERKQVAAGEAPPPEATAAQPPAGAGNMDELKQRLVGNWAGSSDAGQLIIDFAADGTLKITSTPTSAPPNISQGTWESVRADGPNTLVIKRTIGSDAVEATITFEGNDKLNLASQNTAKPIPLQRRS